MITAFKEMPPPHNKTELQAFLGLINYLGKFSPSMATICEPLQKLTSSRGVWSWNALYQAIYDKAKLFIKANTGMKFYNENKALYLKTDMSGVGLDTLLLQARDGATYQKDTAPDNIILQSIALASKSLTSAECRYSNIQREALGILHGLDKFHNYCFVRDVNVITNHKLLVAKFNKDAVTPLAENPVHSPENSSVQDQNITQTKARNIYCRLALLAPQGEQR